MENIEILTHQALQSIDCKMRDQNEVNWEQRRYEIAKEAMAGILCRLCLFRGRIF